MKCNQALKQLRQLFSPNAKGFRGTASKLKVDKKGLTVSQVLDFLIENISDSDDVTINPPQDFEGLLKAVGPEGHVTLIAGDGSDKEPLYQMEILCEAGDWKGVRLGDDSLSGLMAQGFELVQGKLNEGETEESKQVEDPVAEDPPKKKTRKKRTKKQAATPAG